MDKNIESPLEPIIIFVDADACPVKAEIYRVAERYGVQVMIVANSFIAIPRDAERVERVIVPSGLDVAMIGLQSVQGREALLLLRIFRWPAAPSMRVPLRSPPMAAPIRPAASAIRLRPEI